MREGTTRRGRQRMRGRWWPSAMSYRRVVSEPRTPGITSLSSAAVGAHGREAAHDRREWGEVSPDRPTSVERTEAAGGVARCGSRANRLVDRVSQVQPDKE
jgi:hypothetical protein